MNLEQSAEQKYLTGKKPHRAPVLETSVRSVDLINKINSAAPLSKHRRARMVLNVIYALLTATCVPVREN